MDLGVSSPQLDEPQRGFSFRGDGPLDMRMDTSRGETAAQWLDRVPESEIVQVLFPLGEERFARRIARAIVAHRPLQSTARLAEIVSAAVPAAARGRRHDATKTFQAIRMQINSELEEITAGLDIIFYAASDRCAAGGDQLPFAGGQAGEADVPASVIASAVATQRARKSSRSYRCCASDW